MTWQVIQDQLSLDMVPLVAQCDCEGPGGWQGINFLACILKQTQARVCRTANAYHFFQRQQISLATPLYSQA